METGNSDMLWGRFQRVGLVDHGGKATGIQFLFVFTMIRIALKNI